MKLFKNYKTKKQLRREIADLQSGLLSTTITRPYIKELKCDTRKVRATITHIDNAPIEWQEKAIAHMIGDTLLRDGLIDFKTDSLMYSSENRTFTGSVTVVVFSDGEEVQEDE